MHYIYSSLDLQAMLELAPAILAKRESETLLASNSNIPRTTCSRSCEAPIGLHVDLPVHGL